MHHVTGCSTLEDLAALAEGRLRGAERERVVDHLADCADCREVLAESLETEDVEAEEVLKTPVAETEEPLAPVVPLRPVADGRSSRFGRPARAAALAASAVLAVGVVVILQANARRSPPDPRAWLAAMSPSELASHTWGGVRLRGGEAEIAELTRPSTELGGLLVDLEVALAAGDDENVRDFLRRIATICDDAGAMDTCVTNLRSMADMDDAATMKSQLTSYRLQLERELRERFDSFFIDLGTFLNEAKFAARTGHTDFLDSPRAQRYVEWVLSQGHERLPDALLSRVELVRREDSRSYRDQQADVAELLSPVRDKLLVLRDSKQGAATRGDAAEQALDTLSR